MKKLLLLAFLSVSVQASEIDNLILTSGSIKQTFNTGIMTVSGQSDYASLGGISPTGMATNAHLTYDQAEAYNTALANVTVMNTTMTAQEYFDQQAQDSFDGLSTAIGTYVEASSQLISAVQVNEMATQAQTTEQAVELQTYVENNELAITTEQVDTYNGALDMVETAAQSAAAFTAVAADVDLVSSAQEQADALGQSFHFAETTYYSQGNFTVSLSAGNVSLDVSGYLKTALDVLAMGQQGTFYTTGPTANDCFFSSDPKACER